MGCRNIMALALMPSLLSGCYVADRVLDVGSEPPLTRTQDPTQVPGYQPVTLPMPRPEHPPLPAHASNSLWQQGAKGFFKDQTAKRVGDLITIDINFDDKAETKNKTDVKRDSVLDVGIDTLSFLGVKPNSLKKPKTAAKGTSKNSAKGDGNVTRSEKIKTRIAAVVTQVLPNGNLVIMGRQEMRINFDVREIIITGIVRRADISTENVVKLEKIAEARVSYGGRGQIQDMQQPGWGHQLLNTLAPF